MVFEEKKTDYIEKLVAVNRTSGKYESLKEETLKNNICCMNIKLWNELLTTAYLYAKTMRAKSIVAGNRGNTNNMYEIPVGLGLTASHLLSMMIYTNMTEMQYKYKKYCCRKIKEDDDEEKLLQRHREISNWYKLLMEAVLFYGEKVKKRDVFFTGINIRLLFNTFSPRFYCPVSTTTSWTIANNFSKGKGLILKLSPAAGSFDKYFDVSWFSNFPQEKEKLFVIIQFLEIMDLQYFHGSTPIENIKYIGSFKLLSSLFAGHFVFKLFQTKKTKIKQKTVLRVLRNYKYNNVFTTQTNDNNYIKNDVPMFMQQLFFNFVQKFKSIFLIKSEYLLLKQQLRQELISFPDDDNYDEMKDEQQLNEFEHCVSDISHDIDHGKSSEIIDKIKKITQHLLKYPIYKSGSSSHKWWNPMITNDASMRFLNLLGFTFNDDAKTAIHCAEDPSLDILRKARQSLDGYNPLKLKYSAFFRTLSVIPSNIFLMEEYSWIMSVEEFAKLKNSRADEINWCSNKMTHGVNSKS